MPYFSFIAKIFYFNRKGAMCVRNDLPVCGRQGSENRRVCNEWTPNYVVISSFTANHSYAEVILVDFYSIE